MKKFERDVTRITVDLDKAQGRKPREGKPADTVVVELKYTKTLNFAPLNAFIANQTDFDVNCLEAISKCSLVELTWAR